MSDMSVHETAIHQITSTSLTSIWCFIFLLFTWLNKVYNADWHSKKNIVVLSIVVTKEKSLDHENQAKVIKDLNVKICHIKKSYSSMILRSRPGKALTNL